MLDTNVVLDKLLKRDGFYSEAQKLFIMYAFGDASNYISVNMLTDLFYIIKKEQNLETAYHVLSEGLSTLNVCGISSEDCTHCFNQRWNDFEDCLVAKCAENINADYIVTRNKSDFINSTIPALTPTEFLDLVETDASLNYEEIDFSKYLDT